ncbi:MAG TPA: sugar transferase [Solirubrobacteraceae bacterium]|nr:sugar transferase [Solirubrobacteraceae bacterium]
MPRLAQRALDPRSWAQVRGFADVVVLCLASSAALFGTPGLDQTWTDRWLAAMFPLAVAALLYARRTPDERLNGTLLDIGAHVLGVVSLAAMISIALESIAGAARPLELPIRLWLFGAVYLGISRVMLYSIRSQALRSEAVSVPTLIVGAGVVGIHLVKRLAGETRYGLRPVGFLDANPLPHSHPDDPVLPVLGSPDDLADAVTRTGARHVILAFSAEPDHVLVARVRECEALGIGVSLVPRLFESINARTTLDHVGGMPLLTLRPIDPRGWQFAIKHALDRAIALIVLALASPIMLVIAAAVKLSSPGPLLFRQRRVGRDGRAFDVLKFRTMRELSHRPESFVLVAGLAPGGVEGEDRRTAVGRYLRELSLDELPQLFNVLRGDMSLVGPRPERLDYVQRFSRDVARYEDRHRVKSGITGWAQVHGLRGQTSIADRVEWDNYYIQNWSLRLDLRILAMTVAEVLRFREPD